MTLPATLEPNRLANSCAANAGGSEIAGAMKLTIFSCTWYLRPAGSTRVQGLGLRQEAEKAAAAVGREAVGREAGCCISGCLLNNS